MHQNGSVKHYCATFKKKVLKLKPELLLTFKKQNTISRFINY